MPPPWTGGQAVWHSLSVVHDPQVPPPLLLELLSSVPLSSSPPLLLPEEVLLVLLPEDDEVLLLVLPLPLELLPYPLSRVPGVPASPKSNPLPDPCPQAEKAPTRRRPAVSDASEETFMERRPSLEPGDGRPHGDRCAGFCPVFDVQS